MQQAGRVRPHQTSLQELDDLRAVVERDLADAGVAVLSNDRRFATAYNAALQTSKMVIACAGYRVSGPAHHQTTFEALETAMGSAVATYSAYFETCRRKRNMVDYDISGIATDLEVEQIVEEASALLADVENWIAQQFPSWQKHT